MDEVREDIHVEYYDIHGTTVEELYQQMSELGPKDSDGNWFAKANWAIDWDYPIPKGNSCEPVQVIAWIQYILPRWVDKSEASAELQARWDAYELLLKKHEEHHKDIAVKYGRQFIAEIKKIDSYSSCKELEDRIGAIHAQGIIINACSQEQAQYDQDTNHGVAEGVIL
jgi:predicted secreted Zn-dependent protease